MAWVAVCLGIAAGVARGEDDRIEEANATAAAARAAQQANRIDLQSNFDANLFQQRQGAWVLRNGVAVRTNVKDGDVDAPALARLRRDAREALERIERGCALTDEQRESLSLALESDARRVAAEIDRTRRSYAGATVNLGVVEGQRKWHEFQQDVQRCRRSMQEAFGPGSLFAGVLATALEPAQRETVEAETRARRSFRWRSMVGTVLLKLDDTLGLSAKQHEMIERALLAREPRLRLDPTGQSNPHAEQMLVYLTLSEVDAAPIRRGVSERQWRALSMVMNQGRAMKSWLEQQGLVETAEGGAAAPGATLIQTENGIQLQIQVR